MKHHNDNSQEALSALAQIEACASRLDPPPDHLLMSAYIEYTAFEEQERRRLEAKLRAFQHELDALIERILAGYHDAPPQPSVSPYLSHIANGRNAA